EPEAIEAIIEEEIRKLVSEGPSASEMEQAKTVIRAGFIRGIERIGGFGGKADVLAACEVFADDPGCFKETLANIEATTAADIQAMGAKWLGDGDHTIVVVPGERTPLVEAEAVTPAPFPMPAPDPKYTTIPSTVDRSAGVPVTDAFPDLTFPDLQRATLSNGVQVILAERHDVPVVQMSFLFNGGYSADQGGKLGTSSFTMGMLDEGSAGLGALEFRAAAESLGAQMGAGASLDGTSAYLSS